MSRVMKFRGRSIDTGKWAYGCMVDNLWTYSELHALHGQAVCDIIVSGEADNWESVEDLAISVDPATVGQFVGQHDNNGKEIYEGDIIPVSLEGDYLNGIRFGNDAVVNGCVEYDPVGCKYLIRFRRPNKQSIVSTEFGWSHRELKVIGNKYEHPEYL